MARKSGSTISQEELYPISEDKSREELDDARMVDLDVEQESPFLRGQKRVSVRRGSLPKKTANRLTWGAAIAGVAFVCAIAAAALYNYGEHSWRFRVESSDDIEVTGVENVSHGQVMEIMGGDIGRNIFFIPLAQRKAQLEQVPWVESASVMRFVPNRLRVEIHERTPVAFARVGSKIMLIDAGGTLMDLPGAGKKKYSYPVILGMNPGEPLSTRAPRMKLYNDLVNQLDANGGRYSQELSEVDLSDPDDVKVLANNPDGEVLVHLGSSDYLSRYKVYEAHVQQWRQEYNKLDSVDLRYEHQVIVNPELEGVAKSAPLSPLAAKQAMAAGVQPAALITHVPTTHATPPAPAVHVSTTAPPTTHATTTHVKKATAKSVQGKSAPAKAKTKTKTAATPSMKVPVAKTVATATPPSPQSAVTAAPKPAADSAKSTKPSAGKPSPSIAKGQDHP
jgi:cell division protein FtsQ